tara:strand:+ start:505 stop:804 length:300 start_codon:yes stop_codon:yes gene_type:complete
MSASGETATGPPVRFRRRDSGAACQGKVGGAWAPEAVLATSIGRVRAFQRMIAFARGFDVFGLLHLFSPDERTIRAKVASLGAVASSDVFATQGISTFW